MYDKLVVCIAFEITLSLSTIFAVEAALGNLQEQLTALGKMLSSKSTTKLSSYGTVDVVNDLNNAINRLESAIKYPEASFYKDNFDQRINEHIAKELGVDESKNTLEQIKVKRHLLDKKSQELLDMIYIKLDEAVSATGKKREKELEEALNRSDVTWTIL